MLKKILMGFCAFLLILLLALFGLVNYFLTPERVREALVPILEQNLGRPVSIETVNVSLFKGIRLTGLEIRDRDNEKIFITAQEIVFQYQWLPLLVGRFVVDEATLVSPRIRVERNSDQSFNFSDLLGTPVSSTQEAGEKASQAPKPLQGSNVGLGVDLLVNHVRIESGELIFLDRTIDERNPFLIKISEFSLAARQISLDRPFPLEVAGVVAGAALELNGQVDPAAKAAAAQVRLKGLNLIPFLPYFASSIPGRLDSALLDLDFELEASSNVISSRGLVTLTSLNFLPEISELYRIDNADMRLDHDLSYNLESARLDLRKALISYNLISLLIKGELEVSDPMMLRSFAVELSQMTIEDLSSSLPAGLSSQLKSFNLTGAMKASALLEGPVSVPNKFLSRASLTLDALGGTYQKLSPRLSGEISLDQNRLSSRDLLLSLDKDIAELSLEVENVFALIPEASFGLSSRQLDVDALMAALASPVVTVQAQDAEERPQSKKAQEPLSLNIPLSLKGEARVDRALYQGLAIENLNIRFDLRNNRLEIPVLSGLVAGGSFSAKTFADLATPGFAYQGELEVNAVQTDPIISALLPKASGTLLGTMDLSSDFQGSGTEPAQIKTNLRADSNIKLQNFKLTGDGLAASFARFLNLSELKVMSFALADLTTSLRAGTLTLDGQLDGSDLGMKPHGTLKLDGPLDISIPVELSAEITGKLVGKKDFAFLLSNRQGRATLPLELKGTMDKPSFGLDVDAVQGQVKMRAKEELKETIEKKILKKLAPGDPGQDSPEKKLLRGILDNFL